MKLKTIRLALILGAAGALVLGACKSASPTPPTVTGTPTQSSVTATFTPRPTHLPASTAKPKPTLPGTAYPGPVQATPATTPVITPVTTPAPTQQLAQAPTTAPTATVALAPTQIVSPAPGGGSSTQDAYPPPGAYEPTQPGPYPGPDNTGLTPLPNPYPGPATQPPATQPPVTQPPVTQLPTQLTPQPTSTPGPTLATPAPNLVQTTPTPNPIYNTFTPTPTFPLSFGDTQFHVTDPATVELASGDYQFIEFFAYWCGTCRAMAPLLNGLEDQYKDDIQFVFLDIDNPATQTLRKDLHFRIEPEYYLLDGQGKVVKQWSGYLSREDLQTVFDAVLK